MGCAWLLASLIMFVSIIGIPWGRAAFNIAVFTFLPFGNEAISRRELTGEDDIGTGPLTIIGIPFGWVHFKLMGISLAPIGKVIVSKEVTEEARRRHAAEFVDNRRGG